MSRAYREAVLANGNKKLTKVQFRKFNQRPGTMDKDGNPVYTTEQSHRHICDVNNIIAKYDKQGLITHVSRFEAHYGDMTGLDFKSAQDIVIGATRSFNTLPSKIRKFFNNDPSQLLEFMEDPGNRDKVIELGLINPDWTENTDGLGKHVLEGKNIKKTEKETTEGGTSD